ncbi:MAG TPA: desulfoferrodoxin [Acidimicrobiia bacterium]
MPGTAVGARLRCAKCGTEIIVVKGTEQTVVCCDEPMSPREGE